METQFPVYLHFKKWRICYVKILDNTLGELHFAIHSDRKLSVSLQEDEEDALSKDLGMHGDVSCTVRRCASQVRRVWRVATNHAFR